jgi:hypothetical protein
MRRGKPMARTKELTRTGPPKRKRKTRPFHGVGVAVENRHLFQEAARTQGFCQAPNCHRSWGVHDPHHVVYQQHLIDRGLPRFDTRNALRLCRRCHRRHHYEPGWRLPTVALRDVNIAYAALVLGAAAADYLRRYYDDRACDPRVAALAVT